MEKQLVGFEVSEKSVSLDGQDIVGKASASHVGKLGSLKLSVEGRFELLPLVNKGIDKLEELIPGDQKAIASVLKSTIANIKIKL